MVLVRILMSKSRFEVYTIYYYYYLLPITITMNYYLYYFILLILIFRSAGRKTRVFCLPQKRPKTPCFPAGGQDS
jgi:hypothetical protein